jgi:hypothetical protein
LLVKSVTDLEIDEAIREAWTILYADPATSPLARRLAAALLAVTGGTQNQPHWGTPDELWRNRLAVLAEQDAWMAACDPRPGEADCRVSPALLPESQTRLEYAYLLLHSTVRVSTYAGSGKGAVCKPPSRRRNDVGRPSRPTENPTE